MPRPPLAPFLALALLGCTQPQPAGTETVTPRFSSFRFAWSDAGGGMTFRYRILERNGLAAVCGIYVEDWSSNAILNRQVRETLIVKAGSETVMTGVNHFAQVPSSADIPGASAPCATEGKPWNPAYARATPRLFLSRTSF